MGRCHTIAQTKLARRIGREALMHSKMDGATTKGSKNGGVSMSEDERREKIRQGLILKKECDRKALAVVEKLLDPVDREWFRSAVRFTKICFCIFRGFLNAGLG